MIPAVLRFLSACAAIAGSTASASPALAAADCPPLGRMPAYTAANEPELRAYDGVEFSVRKGKETDVVEVRGRVCRQAYSIKEGAKASSDLEIHANYRDQLKKLGAQILYTDSRDTTAKLEKGGEESWFKVYSQETDIDVVTLTKQPFRATLTPPSPPDHRLLGHMPNYVAQTPDKKEFDELTFTVSDGDDTKEVAVQGTKLVMPYSLKNGARVSSDLEIQENYRAALKQLGAEVLFMDARNTVARLEQAGQTIWMRVYSQENDIEVSVIEEKPFRASLAPPQASVLKAALDKEGHVALYLNFDTGRAALKPDAAKTVAELVKLLRENSALKLSIEGHTDNIGDAAANEKLSRDRAAAVADAIVAAGIARDRLKSAGHGADQPLADNRTSEGRAKNRRVELVKG